MEPITYSAQGDYLMPEILIREVLPDNQMPDGRFARLRKGYLKEHRPAFYVELLLSEKLQKHLSDTQLAADVRIKVLMEQLLRRFPPPDKATNQMGWVQHMNAIRDSAVENALAEIVYE